MTNADRYLQHIANLAGAQPSFFQVPNTEPPIISAAFINSPEPGFTTSFTYGVSLNDHPSWTGGKPELMVCIESTDPAWSTIPGVLAAAMIGNSAFNYGATFDVGRPIAPDTAMTSFLVFGPLILDREIATVKLPEYDIRIAQLYPIYEGEVGLIHRIGVDKFLADERLDFVNPGRGDLSVS